MVSHTVENGHVIRNVQVLIIGLEYVNRAQEVTPIVKNKIIHIAEYLSNEAHDNKKDVTGMIVNETTLHKRSKLKT